MTKKNTNVIDFTKIAKVKEFIEDANNRIGELEHALYTILDLSRIDIIKETAASVLNEDLNVYLESENSELDFEAEASFGDDGWYDDNR